EREDRLAARLRELSTVHEIGRAVSSELRIEEVLKLIVTDLTEVLGADQSAVLMVDEEGELWPRAYVGLTEVEGPPALPGSWRVLAKKVLKDHDVSAGARVLGVPLETRENVFGAVVLSRDVGGTPFSEGDARLLVTFADQAAAAISNAELYGEVRRFSKGLEREVEKRTAELAAANARLAKLAVTDGLTGTYNHRHFQERLSLEVARCCRSGLALSLLMIDFDLFKRFNDSHGHLAGDGALRAVARVLQSGRRATDIVARYGGEEFAVLLIDTPKDAAGRVAEVLRRQVAETPVGEKGEAITISVGVAACPDDAKEAGPLIQAADAALYVAKDKGRNRVVLAATDDQS
ncbi:MAG: sensor domain-containing diguanylate cyclase, partial [Deltaproteobacteria bacterium]|nr:sensor domain-containing diguanylate cyclase [Deltaproteobacteria bacterium]